MGEEGDVSLTFQPEGDSIGNVLKLSRVIKQIYRYICSETDHSPLLNTLLGAIVKLINIIRVQIYTSDYSVENH